MAVNVTGPRAVNDLGGPVNDPYGVVQTAVPEIFDVKFFMEIEIYL